MSKTDDGREAKPKAPKATVAPDEGARPAEGQQAASAQPAPEQGTAADGEKVGSVRAAARSVASWLQENFPGHVNAVVFGCVGLLVALFLFCLGLWQTLVLVVFVTAGVAFGQYLDGDPRIARFVSSLFANGTHTHRK